MRGFLPAAAILLLAAATACGGNASWSVPDADRARRQAEAVAAGSGDPNARVGDGKPALYAAVESGDCASAEVLLAAGADVQAQWSGWTPLQAACGPGRGRCAALLLRHGAAPDRHVRGAPPLFLATLGGDADTIRSLAAAGARVDAAYAGRHPIQIAAEAGHTEAVRALLEAGADPNTRGRGGSNPMHLAAAAGHDETAAVLLAAGARLTEVPSEPWMTARTFSWAADRRRRQGDAARAEELEGIACEYYPSAAAELRDDGAEREDDRARAEEAAEACGSRRGDGGVSPPPWSPARTPL